MKSTDDEGESLMLEIKTGVQRAPLAAYGVKGYADVDLMEVAGRGRGSLRSDDRLEGSLPLRGD